MSTTTKPDSVQDSEEEEDTFDPMDPALQRILQDVLNDRAGIIEESLRAHFMYGIDDVISDAYTIWIRCYTIWIRAVLGHP